MSISKLSVPIVETILVVNTQSFASLSRIQPHAAGLDIGAHEIWACIPGEADTQIVRLFGTYTPDLHALGQWLTEHQIRTGQVFRLAASSVTRSDCAFGAFYRRKKSQIGPAQAIVATAHMIARTVYFMLKNQVSFVHVSAASFDQRYREQQIRSLHRKAAKLGFQLTPISAVS